MSLEKGAYPEKIRIFFHVKVALFLTIILYFLDLARHSSENFKDVADWPVGCSINIYMKAALSLASN